MCVVSSAALDKRAGAALSMLSNCSPATDKLQYQHNQCDQKQNVDIGAQHVESNEAQQPQHQQYYEDCPEHLYPSPCLFSALRYGMVRLA